MARKARGPNATSAKVDPAHGKSRTRNKKMGLAEEVRTMMGRPPKVEKTLDASKGRSVSASDMITLSTAGDEEEDDEEADVEFQGFDDEEVEEDSEEDGDDQFSESSEGSEEAEIDVDDLEGIEDVEALEKTDLEAIEMPTGEALTKLQKELAFESDEDSDDEIDRSVEEAANGNIELEDEADESEVALSDIDEADAADIVPVIRETINNVTALNAAYNRIALELPDQFSLHQTLTTTEPFTINDNNDDLERELGFYKQGLEHVNLAQELITKEGAAWSRPSDYFAEMVKTDDHMERIRKELIKEATSKKASEDAKKQRDLKKFGKQVQINKALERNKQKKATTDKLKALKRKRGTELEGKEDFDVALDEAVSKAPRTGRGGSVRGSSARDAKDKKFGFGGKKRYSKSNTAESTTDFGGSSMTFAKRGAARGRGGSTRGRGRGGARRGSAPRPGKSKRH